MGPISAIADGVSVCAGMDVPALKITASARALQQRVPNAERITANIVMAYVVMAKCRMQYSYGLCSYGQMPNALWPI